MGSHDSSFSSLRAYLRAVSHTPSRLARRAVSVSTSYEEMSRVRARSGSTMRKTLRWYDLVSFGIGGMVGAGVFVTTGRASHVYAGPAVVLSYAIAGFCALLSAFCYTEFAVDMPVAGGAFSYLRVTFGPSIHHPLLSFCRLIPKLDESHFHFTGEFAAFITGANLVIDYVLSNAAVARGFTAYLGSVIGISSAKWRLTVPSFPEGFNRIDIVAVAVVLLITIVICYSTRESSVVNMILTALHILFIVFVIVIGFWRGNWKNFTEPGNPENPSGFFPRGAAGYDAVSTMAEEVKDPVKDIPVGVSGSVIIVTVLYCLMAASMSKLLPYDMIDAEAPFSAAFNGKSDGWGWVSRVIGVGASFGILTSLLVAMLGQARYMCVIGRSNVVPTWFARVHPRTSTPVNASAFLGIFTAAIALFTDLDVLLNLVSIGTLFVFYMVANAVIYRRYVVTGTTNPWPTLSFLCSFSFTSIMFTLIWKFVPTGKAKAGMLSACGVIAVAILQLFQCMVPQARKPEFWGVPLMPWIPSISIFLNVFLLGALDGPSYLRFGFFSVIAVLFYVFYSVHASYDAEGDGSLSQKNGEIHAESKESEDQSFKV
ncbi:Cationic amino acid transporter, C-terminal [Sesbania bispinosa]|nr:Cationic amino acid transporter, C-terminal [Sesbania bispinosa]